MYNVLAAMTTSAVVLLSTFTTLACEQRTDAVIQQAAAAPKVLLAQATQQENPSAQSGREAQSGISVGDRSTPPADSMASTKQPSVLNQPSVTKQKEEAQKLGQEVK